MCGIVAVCGEENAQDILIKGLELLEYRGYDSAGIALVEPGGFAVIKTKGKVGALKDLVKKSGKKGSVGIAHTRWATHGEPNDANAHPHETKDIVLVHNGVVENYAALKEELLAKGYKFKSQTDTEVLAQLIQSRVDAGDKPFEAMQSAIKRVKGTYAIEIIFKSEPDKIYGAKLGSPLAIGTNGRSHFMGSDAIALGHCSNKIAYLEEGDSAVITKDSSEIFDRAGNKVERRAVDVSEESLVDKGQSDHFMQKEIYEQPAVIARVIATEQLGALRLDFGKISKIHIVACGTSYHAGLVAKYWIESLTPIWVEVEVASEFRYRRPTLLEGELAIFISQSGETADTLAALRYAKEKKQNTIAIVNVATSTIARESDAALLMHAGAEVGVASTKAFTAALVILAQLAIKFAEAQGGATDGLINEMKSALANVPALCSEIMGLDSDIREIARKWVVDYRDAIYIGRGYTYPIALEGALKIKEISYLHAEGYSAGELKHGPIALISKGVPVIVLAPYDVELFEKTISNMHEVKARGGTVIFISNRSQCEKMKGEVEACIPMPETDGFIEPLLYALPIQMLAYHAALLLGRDVDHPRNLAKSVTVE